MLKLKQKRYFTLPLISFSASNMQFAPLSDDADELLVDIASDSSVADNNWQLTERPDGDQLAKFWGTVEADVQKDPEWFSFSDD